jgi:hypothetical protein
MDLSLVFHDLLLLGWVNALHDLSKYLNWKPTEQREQEYLDTEGPRDVRHLEVLSEENYTSNIDQHRQQDRQDHQESDLSNL